jgi:peptide/nickel transport system ATP-binding protein
MNRHAACNTPGQQPTVLSVRQLRLTLPMGGHTCELIKGIDLDLHAGEVLGLVGESGCGKSLTANALLGLMPSAAARLQTDEFVLNGEHQLAALDEKHWSKLRGRQLAMIFQEPASALDPVFTIGQQMRRVIQRHLAVDRHQASSIASTSLAECGLNDSERVLASYPHQLSGGMRQRVMIAMALSCKPAVLIADEATSALDISSRDQVLTLLHQVAEHHGTAILLITHDLSALARICHRTLVMYAGRIVESGPTERLLKQPRHPYTAALLRATPRISLSQPKPVQAIPGRAHALHQNPPGCAFAKRCTSATNLCTQQLPVLQPDDTTGRSLACHHPLSLAGSAS